ncbi:hypothetical protein ACFRAE_00180 [Sphingobacterium sp. HJSM2_6]|uniref:hypothetical protein n=1 Tax=Sphingobacterium sp. HJSM2_6 TaxID=3366264 RepID=UPI003BDCB39B
MILNLVYTKYGKRVAAKSLSTSCCFYFLVLIIFSSSCRKTEFRAVENPAYIRVFNNLNYEVSLSNKEELQPFFCLFIDPEFDESGKPISGLVQSDFLDKRTIYASPNPAHSGASTSKFNPEYPGKDKVPTGPILNGFDLTNWAQISAGKRRIVFMSRPISNVPFAQLPEEQQKKVFLDTIIDLKEHEVYTIHLLQKDFNTKQNGLYVREENFHKLALSDTLTYVNFYNLSPNGFWQAENSLKPSVPKQSKSLRYGIRDTMNAFFTHISVDTAANGSLIDKRIPEFSYQFAGTIVRNIDQQKVAPYYSFPIFLRANNTKKIYANTWQYLQLIVPPADPINNSLFLLPPNTYTGIVGEEFIKRKIYAYVLFDHSRYLAPDSEYLPSLLVNVHSGINNPQSFGVVNTLEIIGGNVYLSTVQRRYPRPIY